VDRERAVIRTAFRGVYLVDRGVIVWIASDQVAGIVGEYYGAAGGSDAGYLFGDVFNFRRARIDDAR
jgi:hypothetical protein